MDVGIQFCSFLAQPSEITWLMEDRLVPWYHYIPAKGDLSDLAVKIESATTHDADCQLISTWTSRYVNDIWSGPTAQANTQTIISRIMMRYQELYGDDVRQCFVAAAAATTTGSAKLVAHWIV
jgi:Glycosyl transferase family 90